MPGIIVLGSKNATAETLDNVIKPLLYQDNYKVERFVQPGIAAARIHLGHFNPEPQPIFNEDRSLMILMDGRIYGYEKDMEVLKQRGHRFAFGNDPEFCLHSYEEYGKDFIKKLDGTFVFAIINMKNGHILVANDRYAFRIHHITFENGSFYMTPEAKGILQVPGFVKELNDEAVAEYFAFGEFWGGKTFFKGIKMLPPASILTFDGNKMSIEKYWEFSYKPDYKKTEKELVEELVKSFSGAVGRQLEKDLRQGIALSGGLDSRAVLAAAPKESRKNIKICTYGTEQCDEAVISKDVVKEMGVGEQSIYEITPEMIINNSRKEIWRSDGSSIMGVSFVYPILSKFSKKADIIFDGYAMDLTLGGSYLKKKFFKCKDDQELKQLLMKRRKFADAELAQLFKPEFYKDVKDVPARSFNHEYLKVKAEHPANRADEFAMRTHVTVMHVGCISVRAIIEVAHPSSDNEFFGVLMRIPPEMRRNHRIYRKFLMKLSPEMARIKYSNTMVKPRSPIFVWQMGVIYNFGKEILKRKLYSASGGRIYRPNNRSYVDYDGWFKCSKEWRAYFENLLFSEDSLTKKYINTEYVRKLYDEQISGKTYNNLKLLQIAGFELFLRSFFGEVAEDK